MDSKRFITIDEISVPDGSNSHGGVRRCRDTDVTTSGSVKRRKFDSPDQEIAVQSENNCRSGVDVNSPEDVVSSAETGACEHASSSPYFNDCLSVDLKTELRFETETATETETFISGNDGFSRESSSSSDFCLDSDKTESFSPMKKNPAPPAAVNSRHKPATTVKTPMAAEIDEFLSSVEKKEQQRFSDKYNFDIVNDVPMDGRYQWVQLTP